MSPPCVFHDCMIVKEHKDFAPEKQAAALRPRSGQNRQKAYRCLVFGHGSAFACFSLGKTGIESEELPNNEKDGEVPEAAWKDRRCAA